MEVVNAIGRRKTSVARIYLKEGSGVIKVNNKDVNEYFPLPQLQLKLAQPFKLSETEGKYDLDVNVDGGGFNGQVGAIVLAISRALLKVNPEYRSALKEFGLLTRDPRMVERKKPGQKKARKRFQFSKR